MRRYIGLTIALLGLALGTALPALAQRAAPESGTDNFTFLDVTDTHQTAAGSTEPLRQLAEEAARMNPKPAFIIDTGDITEAGRPEEYARFKEAISGLEPAGIRFYSVPGNHDVRWSPNGKEGFEKAFGRLYQAFDYGKAHFVLLDSTIVLQHWGHFDKAELDWLKKDLAKVRPETPIFLFMHHWIGRDSPGRRVIDNEYDLVPILKSHNVIAIFTGHGHQDLVWKTNGVTTLMARGLYQGSHYQVSVTPLLVSIDRIVKEKPEAPIHIATLAVAGRSRPSQVRTGWDDPDVPFLERRRPAMALEPRAVVDNPDKEKGEYRVDDGPWKPMQKDRRDLWRDQFLTADMDIGIHTADLRLTTSNEIAYENELIFEVERASSEPTRKWAIDMDGPIQSSPTLSGQTLYVTDLSGHLSALTVDKGKKRWSYAVKGSMVSTPVVSNGLVYAGSTDHFLYAIEADSGRLRWKYDTGSPVLATAAAAAGIVCVGGSHQIVGLDAATGAHRWTQPAGAFFESAAATDGQTFYLGGWDNTLYALDAATGTAKWTATMGRAPGASPAASFYYSPAIATPSVSAGRLYICSNDGLLHAVDAATGHDVWAIHAPAGHDVFGYGSPVVHGDTVYVGGLGDNGDIYAVAADTGSIRWRSATGREMYNGGPKFAPDGRTFAIMALKGRVSIYDAGTGRRLWGYELGPGDIFSTPEYDGHTVYTVTMANDVQAIDAPSATPSAAPSAAH